MPLSKVRVYGIGIVVALGIFLSIIFFLRFHRSATPNIIIFAVDTLRADHLSSYGYPRKTSPHVDRFAKDSVLFEKAVSQANQTTPAFMSIFTGLTPWVHLLKSNPSGDGPEITTTRLDEKIQTLPQIFRRKGYQTIGLHGGGSVDGKLGFDKGFDHYYLWDVFTKGISEVRDAILKSKQMRRPFFLFLHNYICHSIYLHAPPEYSSKFLTQRVPGIPVSRNDLPKDVKYGDYYDDFWKKVDLSDPRHRDHLVALYDGAINYEDHLFGEMIEILKKEGLYDQTLIIFISDHGEEFYEHGGREHTRMFAETLDVPLIIKFPGNRYAGKTVRDWVRTMDLLPTILDFLKIEHESDGPMQGVSFAPLVTGQGTYQPLVVSYGEEDKIRYIMDGFVYSSEHKDDISEWLFDSTKDPHEQYNLASSRKDVALRMRSLVDDIRASNEAVRIKIGAHAVESTEKNDELSAQLRSLGYLV